ELDITFVSRVDEQLYGQVLALCRCVLLPLFSHTENVLLSVVDSLASGLPLIATRQAGFARLERENAPIALCEGPRQLSARTRELLEHEDHRRAIGRRAVACATKKMDIYNILETIVREQVI
ncbi:MAG TPA: glycosyltransferase, partial [Polyangiaceae bacterium]|nr:glycosyltransferase [Polyangiaceae bacterium]